MSTAILFLLIALLASAVYVAIQVYVAPKRPELILAKLKKLSSECEQNVIERTFLIDVQTTALLPRQNYSDLWVMFHNSHCMAKAAHRESERSRVIGNSRFQRALDCMQAECEEKHVRTLIAIFHAAIEILVDRLLRIGAKERKNFWPAVAAAAYYDELDVVEDLMIAVNSPGRKILGEHLSEEAVF